MNHFAKDINVPRNNVYNFLPDFQYVIIVFMADREMLLALRNEIINQQIGKDLFSFLHDKVTQYAVKNLDAVEIRGMCRIIQDLKDIPEKV